MNTRETKFSPGPWRACKEGECSCGMVWSLPQDFPVFTSRGQDGNRAYIGEAHTLMADTPEHVYASIPAEMAHANAKLIAAAPELYAALDDLCNALARRFGRTSDKALPGEYDTALAVLARASGEAK